MLRKGDCRKALEARLRVFEDISSLEDENIFYHRCCSIVWFLEEVGVFDTPEALEWADKFADTTAKTWWRLTKEGRK